MSNCLEFALFFAFRWVFGSVLTQQPNHYIRYAFIWENKKKAKARHGQPEMTEADYNATAFQDLTDKQNPK